MILTETLSYLFYYFLIFSFLIGFGQRSPLNTYKINQHFPQCLKVSLSNQSTTCKIILSFARMWFCFGRFLSYLSYLFSFQSFRFGRSVSVVSFRRFRWFRFGRFGAFVSVVSVLSFRCFALFARFGGFVSAVSFRCFGFQYMPLSKALADNQISDGEFQLLMTEFSQYNVLKDAVRAKLTRQLSRLDVEKIKKRCPKRDGGRISKKYNRPRRRFELTFENSRLYLHIIKT